MNFIKANSKNAYYENFIFKTLKNIIILKNLIDELDLKFSI